MTLRIVTFVVALSFLAAPCRAAKGGEEWCSTGSSWKEAAARELGEVTPAMYPTLETRRQMMTTQEKAGGVNKFDHQRELVATDNQRVVRMNRDTYYSSAVVDVSHGAKITMPETDKYMSLEVISEDHRIQPMFYGPGTFDIKTHAGNHAYVLARLSSELSKKEVQELQDKMKIDAKSNMPFEAEAFDVDSFREVEDELRAKMPEIVERDGSDALVGMFTAPTDASNDEFDQEKYEVGAAVGWGGAQIVDNIYEMSNNYDANVCHTATFPDPQDEAFWSVTVYDKAGFMFNDVANVNSYKASPNDDGVSYTISFGCGSGAINNIETKNPTGVFNFIARHYRPSDAVRSGEVRIVPTVKTVASPSSEL